MKRLTFDEALEKYGSRVRTRSHKQSENLMSKYPIRHAGDLVNPTTDNRDVRKGDKRRVRGAKRTTIDNHTFASKGEAECYEKLKELGEALVLSPAYEIMPSYKYHSKKYRGMRYTPDFELAGNFVIEYKGKHITEASRMRMKMFLYLYGRSKKLIVLRGQKQVDAFVLLWKSGQKEDIVTRFAL